MYVLGSRIATLTPKKKREKILLVTIFFFFFCVTFQQLISNFRNMILRSNLPVGFTFSTPRSLEKPPPQNKISKVKRARSEKKIFISGNC